MSSQSRARSQKMGREVVQLRWGEERIRRKDRGQITKSVVDGRSWDILMTLPFSKIFIGLSACSTRGVLNVLLSFGADTHPLMVYTSVSYPSQPRHSQDPRKIMNEWMDEWMNERGREGEGRRRAIPQLYRQGSADPRIQSAYPYLASNFRNPVYSSPSRSW